MSGLKADRVQLEQLKNTLYETFQSDLAGKKVLFMDYPLYNNVGDWLIYHGTMKLLKDLGCKIQAQYCTHNFQNSFNKSIPEDWIILLHGGGNFGDIYDVHQNLRREVIQRFPRNKIICMPQSVHFNKPENFLKEADVYNNHPDITIHVRDRESFAFLAEYLLESKLRLTPDMASTLIGSWEWNKNSSNTLFFRRKDKEAPAKQDNLENSFDWVDMFSSFDRKLMGKIMRLAKLEKKYSRNLGAAFLWSHCTWFILRKANRTFSPYQTVDTDRLHGMIFALLLGKDVILRDNSYGKIKRYTKLWFANVV